MKSVCFYFQVHQPYRVKQFRVFDIGKDAEYFNDRTEALRNNRLIVERMAESSYIPTTKLVLELLEKYPELRVSYSFSGVALEQLERYVPEVVDLLKRVIHTGQAEVLGETYYHSLAFFYSQPEFERQVTRHREVVQRLFGCWPRVFRNTELAYRNDLGTWAERAGYAGVITGGWDAVIGWHDPQYVYKAKGTKNTRLLIQSDEQPSSVDAMRRKCAEVGGDVINFFMDYDALEPRDIEDFLMAVQHDQECACKTPSEVFATHEPQDEIDAPYIVTWFDGGKDLEKWVGNPMQKTAIETIYALEPFALEANDAKLLDDWRRLQTSDHFEYMNTEGLSGRSGRGLASAQIAATRHPYETPYDAYISYMNALSDLRLRMNARSH
jgi:alpha-amylase